MTANDRAALNALQRRLSHTEAIAALIADRDDTQLGEGIRGIALLLSDCGYQLEAILSPVRGGHSE